MLVKDYWSEVSEQQMWEWTHATPTAYNRKKRAHYAFWQSVKNLSRTEIKFADVLRIEEIREIQARENKRPAFKRK